jgi:hypothetical protein
MKSSGLVAVFSTMPLRWRIVPLASEAPSSYVLGVALSVSLSTCDGFGARNTGLPATGHGTRLNGDRRGDPVSVIHMTAEDSWESTLVPRLTAAGADLDRIMNVEIAGDDGYGEGLSLPEDGADLRDAILQTGAMLVVIDPCRKENGGHDALTGI